jgi:hypothetical protein
MATRETTKKPAPKNVKRRFELTVTIVFDRTVEDAEDALSAEMDEVQGVLSDAVNNYVPKQFRGAVRVWVVRSSMGAPA